MSTVHDRPVSPGELSEFLAGRGEPWVVERVAVLLAKDPEASFWDVLDGPTTPEAVDHPTPPETETLKLVAAAPPAGARPSLRAAAVFLALVIPSSGLALQWQRAGAYYAQAVAAEAAERRAADALERIKAGQAAAEDALRSRDQELASLRAESRRQDFMLAQAMGSMERLDALQKRFEGLIGPDLFEKMSDHKLDFAGKQLLFSRLLPPHKSAEMCSIISDLDGLKDQAFVNAKDSVPLLTRLLATGAGPVRGSSARVLGWLGAVDAVLPLIQALSSPEPDLRKSAAQALGRIGPRASQAIPALEALLKSSDPAASEAAAALKKIRQDGEGPT